jgi:protein-tyrosine-phosphatase
MTAATDGGRSAEESVQRRRSAAALQRRFAGVFGLETVERVLIESFEGLGQGKVRRWMPVLAERVATDRLRAVARTEGLVPGDTPYVVFLCVHNAGRSQMAAGWLQHLAGGGVEVFTGGSDPARETNPAAVEAMAEVGIDLTTTVPKPWSEEVVAAADVVVTMGCGDACPVYPGRRYEDWDVADPAGLGVEGVRPIRDELRQRVVGLMAELGVASAA